MPGSLTAFVIATSYSLLSGAVLGFMHSALPHDLQPSAADRRFMRCMLPKLSLRIALASNQPMPLPDPYVTLRQTLPAVRLYPF